ncbi:cytochrome b/b6 domain-containing protein [Halioxenophilus aromaticivorans]
MSICLELLKYIMEITPSKIKAWDLPTRVWHWSIVALIAFLWFSAEIADDLMDWHMMAGRTLLGLLLYRIVWGVMGSETARFSRFVRSPLAALTELKGLAGGQHTRYIGHNPAGGWFVLVLIALMALQAISGLFVSDGYFYEGPWASSVSGDVQDTMMDIHELGINLIIAAVVIHVLAIVVHSLRGDHLVGAMITGNKKVSTTTADGTPTQWRSPWLALAVAAACVGVLWFVTA